MGSRQKKAENRQTVRQFARSACGLAACLALLAASPAQAGEADSDRIALELNRLDDLNGNCRMTLIVANGFDRAIDAIAFEFVMFDGGGLVERITSVDFGRLEAAKTVVRQFDIEGLACGGLGRVLVNSVTRCEGPQFTPKTCLGALSTSARAPTPFGM